MTLVERYIEIGHWPTSKKFVLVAGFALPLHLLAWPAAHFALQDKHLVDITVLDRFLATWCGFVTFNLLFAYGLWRAGKDAQWSAYLFMLPYIAFIVGLNHLVGSMGTVFSAMLPAVLLWTTFFLTERQSWVCLLFGLAAYGLVQILELYGVLPYAPIVIARSIEAQLNGAYLVMGAYAVLGTLLFAFMLGIFTMRTRSLQEQRLTEAQKLIRRYVPSQLADRIIKGEHSQTLKPERVKLTVFFSDIEGFTDASDHLDPEDLAALLNEYLAEMMTIAERHGATINQIVGDGIMAFFGAPQATSDKDHALRAVRMALAMQKRMTELKDVWVERGIQKPFRIRIGVNTGHASVGDYGSPGRKLYSAIGVQTNLAARIQASCDPGKVLISHSTWALVHDEIPHIDKGDVQLKGIHYPVHVYEVSDTDG
jgi:adenylate cyclase